MKIYPKKSLGQSFLINKGVLDKVINAAELNNNDLVLEIGAGTGNLTEKLAEKSGQVITVEKDRRLIEALKEKFSARGAVPASGRNNVEIIEGDILKLDIEKLLNTTSRRRPSGNIPRRSSSGSIGEYKIVANIPYYITSNLLRRIFEDWPRPKLIVLMVQKEVAQRIMAKPPPKNGKTVSGQAPMNLLALSVQFYSEPKIVSYVSRGSFRPMPKVDSAIIRLVPRSPEGRLLDCPEADLLFFKLIKIAFAGKRKQLKNTIGIELLNKTGIKPESRPEELSLNDWLKIASRV